MHKKFTDSVNKEYDNSVSWNELTFNLEDDFIIIKTLILWFVDCYCLCIRSIES